MIYDIAIIGGGPAGYTAAELAGKSGLKTVLFEKNALGGVCLNEGCIPTKTLLYSAKVFNTAKDSAKYGISCENINYDLSKIIARKNKVVRKLVAGIRAKMTEAGVEVVTGEAIIKETTVICNGQTYEAKKLILCAGSETVIPPIPGLKETGFWTSREALDNKEVPESLLIIGGGVIGIEFASFFNTLGAKVVVVEMLDEILGGMDKELSGLLRQELTKKGIEFHLTTKVISVNNNQVEIEKDGEKQLIHTSQILLSAGRKPVLKGITVNEYMQTSNPNIYACGDITGFSLLAHTAVREAEVAVEHILRNFSPSCGGGRGEAMSYKAIPGVVYTNPEIAGVGQTEEALQTEGIPYTVKRLPMAYSGRFVAENEQGNGVCKIIEGEDGSILGVHILGNPASEIIVIAGIAIEKGMKAEALKAMVFPHPTVGEIIKETL
ncbi:MAG: dihydrolipoyl dehydrogenase [Candidatus Symbiothrix sp.]|jgi:dihydrolipoamide dehydrogenase|nr:dihydrolipoyl dehydrogenase [Candidatus Symbiothrix sp.]